MYQINVDGHFDAAHYLRGYEGKCEALHGHRWKVRLGLECDKLNHIGLSIDFKEVKKYLDQMLDEFDHTLLNDLERFKTINPSTENIAREIFDHIKSHLDPDVTLNKVQVWEAPERSICYSGQ